MALTVGRGRVKRPPAAHWSTSGFPDKNGGAIEAAKNNTIGAIRVELCGSRSLHTMISPLEISTVARYSRSATARKDAAKKIPGTFSAYKTPLFVFGWGRPA